MTKPRKGVKGPLVILVLAIAIVATASTAFLGTWLFDSERDKRLDNQDKELAAEAEQAWNAYSAKHDAGEPDMIMDGGGHSRILNSYYGTFEREAQKLAGLWSTTIGLLQGYPFTDTEKDLPLEQLAHVLNPVDGWLWALATRIDDLVAIEVGSQRVAAPPANYARTLTEADAIRDALFSDGDREVHVEFQVRVMNGAMTFAGKSVTHEFTTLHWKPGSSAAAARNNDGKARVFTTSDWGMVRLLAECEPVDAGTYKFGGATIEVKVKGENPFDKSLYSLGSD